ncbi:MAG TPA: type II toxin-antitoxin system HicB family antitoxin [Prolixibacteraceae bacterium]|nr:type II toxin-antitoxin system HicB family antitoxin [Prolixibacteraceae bacterium]
MKPEFNAIIEKSEDGWFVGQIQEMPEVISQGKTLEELHRNLLDALYLVLESHRETTLKLYEGRKIIKERLSFA